MTLVLAARIDEAISVSDARASLSLFFQLEHRQNKGRLVLVSGANGVSIAATLVEANNTSRVNKETQGPFDLVAKIHKEYNTNTSSFRSVVGIKHKRNLLPILWQS